MALNEFKYNQLHPSTHRRPSTMQTQQGGNDDLMNNIMSIGKLLMSSPEQVLPPEAIMRPADTIPFDNGGYGAVAQGQPQPPNGMDAQLFGTLNQSMGRDPYKY